MVDAVRTPGTAAALRAASPSTGDQPSSPASTCVAETRLSSEPFVESFSPAAMIVSAATSATPMVSAEAVMAVRPGARMALRRASMAAGPPGGVARSPHGRGAPGGLHRAPDDAHDAPHDTRGQAQPARAAGRVA